ncbi:thrombospondin type 3 repeat-containing protein [Marinobacteraceae bacterium S3BR75-40.1]
MKRSIWQTLVFAILASLVAIFPAHSAMVDYDVHNSVAYFTFAAPNKIVRYDMASESFLADIPLSQVPTAVVPQDSLVYIAYHKDISTIDLTAVNSQSAFASASSDITGMNILNDVLYAYTSTSTGRIQSFALSDGSLLSSNYESDQIDSPVASVTHSAVFYCSWYENCSGERFSKQTVNSDGTLDTTTTSYMSSTADVRELYLSADETTLLAGNGLLFSTADLTYQGSLAGSIDTAAFLDTGIAVTRDDKLYFYDSSYLQTDAFQLGKVPMRLATHNDMLFAFYEASSNISVEKIDTSSLTPIEMPSKAASSALEMTSTMMAFNTTQGELYLTDATTKTLFAWSSASQGYDHTIALSGTPTALGFDSGTDRLYIGYDSGKVTYVDTTLSTFKEVAFTNLAGPVKNLIPADNYLYALEGPSDSDSKRRYSFAHDGSLADYHNDYSESTSPVWSGYDDRVYWVDWSRVYARTLNQTTGVIDSSTIATYFSSVIDIAPLHSDPTGQLLLTGQGKILDAVTLNELNALESALSDATWLDGTLYTLSSEADGIHLQSWSDTYDQLSDKIIGKDSETYLYATDSALLLVSQTVSGPDYELIDPAADQDSDSILDIADNCPSAANSNQTNTDGDLLGDACDDDDDNDGLPDAVENAAGLDPLDDSDASGDLDNDGFTNYVEHISGTDLNDAEAIPGKVDPFLFDFEDETIPQALQPLPGDNHVWRVVSPSPKEGSASLHSDSLPKDSQTSITLIAHFPAGTLSFDYMIESDFYEDSLEILVDGENYDSLGGWANSWTTSDIAIPDGTKQVTFRFTTSPYHFGTTTERSVYIDNIQFVEKTSPPEPQPSEGGPEDSDLDGIPDDVENQYDALDPFDGNDAYRDYDGDGVTNIAEIFSGYDPDTPDNFPTLDAAPYWPLGDITWTYRSADGSEQIVTVSKLSQPGRFRVDSTSGYDIIERRPDGIFLIKSVSANQEENSRGISSAVTASASGDNQASFEEGLLLYPRHIRLGETVEQTATATFVIDGETHSNIQYTTRITLLEAADYTLMGENTPTLVFSVDDVFVVNGSRSAPFHKIVMYGKELGEVYNSLYEDRELQSVDVDSLSPTSEVAGKPSSDGGGGGGGGGAWSWPALLLLLLCRIGRHYRVRPSA